MKLLALDPSGNWGREGMGTTGICIMLNGEVWKLDTIKASDYASEVEYWAAHEDYIMREFPDHIVFEGYRLYNHKGMSAKTQANSELPTSQLIGFIKMVCYRMDIPYTIQFATDVKTRWQEAILVHLNILQQKGSQYYWNGEKTGPGAHKRDALKHALHFTRYKESKL